MDFVNTDFINAWNDTKLLLTLLIHEASLEFVSQIFLTFYFEMIIDSLEVSNKKYKEPFEPFTQMKCSKILKFPFSTVHIKTPADKCILNKHDKVALTFVFKGCRKTANY